MKSTLKHHLYCLFSYVVGLVVSTVLGNSIILTICSAIWDPETTAVPATQVIMRILTLIIAFVMIYIHKRRDDDERKSFLLQMKEKEYNAKEDYRAVIADKRMWAEFVFVLIVTIVYWAFNYAFYWIFLNIPLFFIFELFANHHLHRAWLKEAKKEKIY